MMSDYQKTIYNNQSKERRDFIDKQLQSFEGWMKGNMFMNTTGICDCGFDIIEAGIKKGNNGDIGITDCSACNMDFCN